MNEEIITKNWEQFKSLLQATNRKGVAELLSYLETTDFKIAPASGKFHLSIKGGLVEHSLNCYMFANDIANLLKIEIEKEKLTITALLHDLCKIHYYTIKQKWDGDYKEKTGQWRKMDFYAVDDQMPLGHGEKSVILAMRFIELYDDEILAIRWHMAFSDPATHFGYPSGIPFKEATARYPLAKIIAMADQMAECYETINENKKKETPQA